MLSLNEIRNVHFRKSNFNGYKAEDVEVFIDEVQESYDQLLRENAELQKRVDVLAQKLEDYQREEDSIRSALMNAQKLGDASLRDAKHKAEIILKDATIKAEKIVANAQGEIKRETEVIDRLQKDVADFKTNLLRLYKEHLTLINSIRSDEILRPSTVKQVNEINMLDAGEESKSIYTSDDVSNNDTSAFSSVPGNMNDAIGINSSHGFTPKMPMDIGEKTTKPIQGFDPKPVETPLQIENSAGGYTPTRPKDSSAPIFDVMPEADYAGQQEGSRFAPESEHEKTFDPFASSRLIDNQAINRGFTEFNPDVTDFNEDNGQSQGSRFIPPDHQRYDELPEFDPDEYPMDGQQTMDERGSKHSPFGDFFKRKK